MDITNIDADYRNGCSCTNTPCRSKNSVDSIYVSDRLASQETQFFGKILNYFNDANKEKKNKKFDFSIIGGPHYSSDTKFGIGLVAAGLYCTDRNDSILPPSMSLCMGMSPQWDSICWEYVETICFPKTNTG